MHMGVITFIFVLVFCVIYANITVNINHEVSGILDRDVVMMSRPDTELSFVVSIDANGNVTNVLSPYNVEQSFYENVVQLALKQGKASGQIKYNGLPLAYRTGNGSISFTDISREISMLDNFVYTFLWISIPLLILIFLISAYFAKRSIKPIEESFTKQKEFIADASHELKTPIATISANADVVISSVKKEDRKWIENIKTESERMSRLLGSMLYLAKSDFENVLNIEEVNVTAVLEDILLPFEALLFEKNISFETQLTENIMVKADREHLQRLIGILLDNAIKYADKKINIVLNSKHLMIENDGETIPKEKINKIFDRFYRVDEARKYTGGFGLGLSIAQNIAQSHGWKISCESNEKSTRFIVHF